MKKILQISNYYYPHRGGIEQAVRDIADALQGEDCIQRIICFNEDAREGALANRRGETVREEVDGVPVIRCGCEAKIRSQSLSRTYPKELKSVLRSFQPDIVIFHYPNPYVAHFLLRYLPPDTRLVMYWHLDIVKQKLLGLLFKGQNSRLLERADRVIAGSPDYAEGSPWLRSVCDKRTVIPYAIPRDYLPVSEQAETAAACFRKGNEGKIICAALGRNVPYKGLIWLIRAARLLDDRFVFYIAGKGTEELAPETKGNPRIHLLGSLDGDTRKGMVLAADIFCFPSITRNEAFGIALAEAMALGKPAVTFAIPGSGVRYVCPDGLCGIEVPNRDVEAYAAAIRKLADDPALRETLGRQGARRVRELFTAERFREKILEELEIPDSRAVR